MLWDAGFSPRKENPGGCPTCGGPEGTVRFDWKLAQEDPTSEFASYTRTLTEQKSLKTGSLLKCGSCGQKWWLDPKRETLTLIPRDKLLLLEKWNSAPSVLPPQLLEKAQGIGATPAHELSGVTDYAEIPCKVRTLQGEVLDKCLITFRSTPPLENSTRPPRFLSEIVDLSPSDDALPHLVRLESARSKQDKPGRAPTWVVAKGRPFLLNWVVNFLDRKGHLGKDIRLAPKGSKHPKGRVLSCSEPEDLTVFIGDWTYDLRKLFDQDIR